MRLPLLSKTSNLPSKHGLSMDYGSLSSKKQVEERIKHGLVKRAKDQEWIKARVDAWKLQRTC
jgi:hypothetical protein